MITGIVGFVIGLIVMDFLWAWRLGLPQSMWNRHRNRRNRNE